MACRNSKSADRLSSASPSSLYAAALKTRNSPQGCQFLPNSFNTERGMGRLAKSPYDGRAGSRKISPLVRSGWGQERSVHRSAPENAHLSSLGAGRKGMLGGPPMVPNRLLPQSLTFGRGRVICIPREEEGKRRCGS